MNSRRHVRLLLAIGLIGGLLTATIETVIGAMSARTIEGQEGWSGGTIPVSASIDQTVDQSGVNQRTGTGAWRISNNTSLGNYNGNFAGWVFGPGLPVPAGQPSSGGVADQFTATLWFRSASTVADGSNIEIDLGTVPGDDRNTFLALTNRDDGDPDGDGTPNGGLQLRVSEPDGATGNFRPTAVVAMGISRGVFHRLDIVAKFLDGDANDTVEYALDGVPLANPLGGTTFGTFEGWRNGLQFTYALSNRLYFRSGAPPSAYGAFADTAAQGFYFDDLFYAVADQSAPALRLAAYATGFEPGYSAGSIQGQEAWSGGTIPIVATVDQTVDLAGLNQRTGMGAWRISNNTSLGNHNGAFSGWVFGPGLPVAAGHPSSGAGANQFGATLWFRSASTAADGSNIEIDLGTVPGDDRNTFLAVTNRADADGGLQLRAGEPDGVTGNFRPTQIIATGIARGVYHRLDIVAKFFDGEGNDTVEYALDGVPLANPLGGTTFGTFEGWRDGLDFTYALSNRLYFRSGAPPSAYGTFGDTAAQGFYFDDLFYAVADQSAPGVSLAAYATGFEPPAIPSPDLTLTKSHVGNLTQGQIGAPFTVTVTNSGTPSTSGVVTLIDNVPTGLTPATASGAGWTCGISGAAVTCTRSDALAPGASYPLVTITVNVATNAPASVANTATISGGGDVNTANNAATDVATILPGPDLTLSKSHVGDFGQGQMGAAYTISATNAGGSPTSGAVSLIDMVPAGLTPATASGAGWTCTVSGATVNCSRSDALAAAANYPVITLTVNVAASAPASVANTATISGGGDVNTANNTATDVATILSGPDLTLSKSHVGDFGQGQMGAAYTISATNAGGSPTSGAVSLIDTVPAGLTPATASGAGWTCTVSGATVNCSRSDALAAAATYPVITLIVNVAPSAPASVTNTATISGGGDVNVTNNIATDVVTILPGSVDLAIAKTDGQSTYVPGTAIGYTITVTNAGPATATGFSIADAVPAAITGVTVACAVTGTGSCGTNGSSGNNISFTAASLDPGAGNTLTLTVGGTVGPDATGALINTVTVTAVGSTDTNPSNNSASDTDTPVTSFTAYLAEGATNAFFDVRIALVNPSATETANVSMRFLKSTGEIIPHTLTLLPMGRATLNPKTIAGLEDANFSTVIESNVRVVVDRTMSWDASGYGSHAETSSNAPATTWYFAEGATHGQFSLFYLLQNATTSEATVEVTYLLPAPAAPIVQTLGVPPESRVTIQVDELPGLEATDVSAVIRVTNGVPISTERAMYLSTPEQPFAAGTDAAGIAAPSTTWFFAEGATGPFFDFFLLLANPNPADAEVSVTYLTSDAGSVTKPYTVAANSRQTISVQQEDSLLDNAAIAATVTSTNNVPILAERAIFWPQFPWYEGHASAGVTATGTRWALADGEAGGALNTQTYILIANTGSAAATVRVTLLLEAGGTLTGDFTIGPNSRFNVNAGEVFPQAMDQRFGAVVESIGATPQPIVVERSMYTNAGGVIWAAGTNALATRLP